MLINWSNYIQLQVSNNIHLSISLFYSSTTWWVSLLVDQRVPIGHMHIQMYVIHSTSVDSERFESITIFLFKIYWNNNFVGLMHHPFWLQLVWHWNEKKSYHDLLTTVTMETRPWKYQVFIFFLRLGIDMDTHFEQYISILFQGYQIHFIHQKFSLYVKCRDQVVLKSCGFDRESY